MRFLALATAGQRLITGGMRLSPRPRPKPGVPIPYQEPEVRRPLSERH